MIKNKKRRVTLFLNQSLSKQAKAQAIVEEISLTILMEKALSEYLPKETILNKDDV